MKKGFLGKLLVGLVILASAVVYLLSLIPSLSGTFGFFNLTWAFVIIGAAVGLFLLLGGLFEKNLGVIKKPKVYFGTAILAASVIVGFLLLVPGIDKEGFFSKYGLAIVLVVVAAALVLGYVAVGGKKYDTADNEKVGYKNYYQRKEEEEKKKK
jgi:peptidoglycan/LPS O-acetylase OafA/YrhL